MQVTDRDLVDSPAMSRLPPALEQTPSIKTQVRILWQARLLIAVTAAVCTFAALTASLVLPKKYEASVLLAAVTHKGGVGGIGALGSIASELGNMAELAGLSTPGQTERAEYVAVLKSRALTEKYIEEHNLLPILFASKWDARASRWRVSNPAAMPTPWKAERYFATKIRKVTTSGGSGLVTLAVTWTNPVLAATWANGLVAMANQYLRTKALNETERDIKYLDSQATKTNVVEERQAIFSVMTMEIDKAMLARGTNEYAFKVLDPAVPPEIASSPKPILWTIGGLGGGLFLGIFFAFVRAAWRESP